MQRVLFVVSRQDPSGQQGQVAPGIFHHLEQLDAILLDHQPVDFPHLVGGEGRQVHGNGSGVGGGRSRKLRSQQTNTGMTMVLVHMWTDQVVPTVGSRTA